MLSCNMEEVACAPPKREEVEKVTNSISSLASKDEDLKPLKVVFHSPSLNLQVGDSVFLRPEAYSAPYMRMVYQVHGIKFILIPKHMVIMKEE